jgi:hypothetical protein
MIARPHDPSASETVPAPCTSAEPAAVPLASADQIHRYLVEAFRIGNRARLRFARLLAALHESRLYLQLGHPGIAHYAEHRFQLGRSETYEMLRVVEVIDERPQCLEAFEAGQLSWTTLKAVTRVATAETEADWLAFAKEHTFAELRAEVQDALEKNRDHPRTDRFGLPNLTTRLVLELTREERARLEAALEKATAEIGERLGSEPLAPKDVLLYLAERFLHTDVEGTPEGRVERTASPFAIVYQQCESCRRSRLLSADGPVEVDPECVDRRKDTATEERLEATGDRGDYKDQGEPEIDRPNPTALARRVKLRDGDRCANPGCGRRDNLQAHHIEHRSNGGRTVADNEAAVCTCCHALIHAGLLEVTGTPWDGLRWTPRSAGLDVRSDAEAVALGKIPIMHVQSAIAVAPG